MQVLRIDVLSKLVLKLIAAMLMVTAFAAPAAAQSPGVQVAPEIRSIVIRGNQRIEASTIGSYLPISAGMPADPELLDLSLKTLFKTGLFADVRLEMVEGDVLLIEVRENPIVNQVLFEGNKRLKEDKITEEIQLAPRAVYTRAKVRADTQRMVELYRAKGRFATIITPKIVQLEQNRVDVVFEVDEGPKTGIAKVNFVGNEVFTSNQLRGVILTRESRWYSFFSSNSNYDPDRLEYERELLRQHYAKNGYADFRVVSAVAELTPDRKDFFITITVDEGEQYRVGEVKVRTTLAKLDNNLLRLFVPFKTGEVFDGEKIEQAIEAITFATGSAGYAFVDVNPRRIPHAESKTMDLVFEVNEGPRVYVERININGNTRTLDKVIRREIRLSEGDAFNRVLVDRSRARIRSLGYFGEVEIEEKPGTGPDRTVLDVQVEEQSTGSFSVGVGVSSTDSFIVDLSVEQANLMGRGQFLRFRVQASRRTRSVDLRFTQPYFLGRNLAAGFSLFNTRSDFEREAGFVNERTGFGLNAGFQVSEYGRGSINYVLSAENLSIDSTQTRQIVAGSSANDLLINGAAPIEVTPTSVTAQFCDFVTNSISPTCDSQGKSLTSQLSVGLSFNKLDDPIRPRKGWRAAFSTTLAGLGGDVQFYKTETRSAYYHPVYRNFIGALKFRAGYIDGYAGDNVRISDRFFEGASTFRGFEVAGVGPRSVTGFNRDGNLDGSSLGGKAYAIGTAEIHLPLPIPDEYGIRAALFSDFGTIGIVDEDIKALNNDPTFFVDTDGDSIGDLAPIQDDLSIRMTAGVSIAWDSPFGPVRFDISEVIRKEIYDQTEGFRFSAGTNF